MYIQHFI